MSNIKWHCRTTFINLPTNHRSLLLLLNHFPLHFCTVKKGDFHSLQPFSDNNRSRSRIASFTFVCSANRFFFSPSNSLFPFNRNFALFSLCCDQPLKQQQQWWRITGHYFFLQTKPKQTRIRKNILCSSSSKGCKANIHDDDGENASSSSSSSVGDLIFKASTTTIVPSLCSGTLCLFVCVFVCLCTGIEFGNGMARERENLHASKSLPSCFFSLFSFFSCSPPFARLHLAPPPPQTKAVIFLPFFWNCCCCCCNRNHRNAAAVQCSTHSQNRLE